MHVLFPAPKTLERPVCPIRPNLYRTPSMSACEKSVNRSEAKLETSWSGSASLMCRRFPKMSEMYVSARANGTPVGGVGTAASRRSRAATLRVWASGAGAAGEAVGRHAAKRRSVRHEKRRGGMLPLVCFAQRRSWLRKEESRRCLEGWRATPHPQGCGERGNPPWFAARTTGANWPSEISRHEKVAETSGPTIANGFSIPPPRDPVFFGSFF